MNQIENHPALPQQEIVDLCKEKGIHIIAYSPLGSTGGPLSTVDPVVKIAQKHGVQPSTVLLSYHGKANVSWFTFFFFFFPSPLPFLFPFLFSSFLLSHHARKGRKKLKHNGTVARGSTVLAKSVTPERIEANKQIINLDAGDVNLLQEYSDDLTKKRQLQRFVYPPFGIDFGFPDKS